MGQLCMANRTLAGLVHTTNPEGHVRYVFFHLYEVRRVYLTWHAPWRVYPPLWDSPIGVTTDSESHHDGTLDPGQEEEEG